jgi:hypothetical protein
MARAQLEKTMTQEQVLTLNHNSADCIKSVMNWGGKKYQNICSGEYVNIEWGHVDYVLASFSFLLLVAVLILVVAMIKELQ